MGVLVTWTLCVISYTFCPKSTQRIPEEYGRKFIQAKELEKQKKKGAVQQCAHAPILLACDGTHHSRLVLLDRGDAHNIVIFWPSVHHGLRCHSCNHAALLLHLDGCPHCILGFRVQGSWFRVQGFRVLGFRVLGFRV
jgi:hypothetical protein